MEVQDASIFCIDFASIFERFWFQLGAQVCPMLASFGPLDAPRNHQKSNKKSSKRSRRPKTRPGPFQELSRPRFWWPWTSFSKDFRSIFSTSARIRSRALKTHVELFACRLVRGVFRCVLPIALRFLVFRYVLPFVPFPLRFVMFCYVLSFVSFRLHVYL